MFFKVEKDKNFTGFRIGRGMFKVADRDNLKIFNHENTEEIEHLGLTEIINKLAPTFIDGFCYTNAESIVLECKRNNIDARFYAGWFFIDGFNSYPIHHAWVVFENKVIDVSIRKSSILLFDKIGNDKTNDWREKYKEEIIEEDVQSKNNLSNNCTFGKILRNNYIYVGCEDTPDNARKIFNDLLNMYPQHPSPSFSIFKKGSKLQSMILKEIVDKKTK